MTLALLVDACAPGDAALANSHWIAERTRERLSAGAVVLGHPDAVRAQLEIRLADAAVTGVALFGHGDPGQLHTALRAQHKEPEEKRALLAETSAAGAVYGSDGEPALDADNLQLLKGRWCHALACGVGLALAPLALEAGAECFVAYQTSLTPEFDAGELPAPLDTLLAALTTETTAALHAGRREEAAIKAELQRLIEQMEAWLDGDEAAGWYEGEGYMLVAGVRGFARQLKREMVIHVRAAAR